MAYCACRFDSMLKAITNDALMFSYANMLAGLVSYDDKSRRMASHSKLCIKKYQYRFFSNYHQSHVSHRDLMEYYKVLGVPVGASQKAIREKYISLAKVLHPDSAHNNNDGSANEVIQMDFRRVTEAYRVLSDKSMNTRDFRNYYRNRENSRPKSEKDRVEHPFLVLLILASGLFSIPAAYSSK